ncbi:flagellar biosynthetic protein FliO [Halomonas marinisediminis]|uniref:Flagellar protein n=1 Tax=Halomonas marinisediminis TaxID=2546095 RepID=A0ABY2DAC0_9GAMM|nr:flagellar biosynthetic protein FliO [Halomonas marinisediminis]TDB01930.1 flagellar biosynthetic protein FliO [Halomonas marinisediminis]
MASVEEPASNAAFTGGDALMGMAALGKVAMALAVVVAIIFLCRLVLVRLGASRHGQGAVKVVAATSVGSRERVVVVEVQDRWLVLGVGNGRVSHLESLPSPPPADDSGVSAPEPSGFAKRLASALGRQASGSRR